MKTSKEKNLSFKKIKKQVKGITLIALVVTIIVLLILAGVALNLTIGQNGIFSRAQQAKEISEKAEWEDRIDMAISAKLIDNRNATLDDIIQELIDEDIIDEESQVNKANGDITTNKPSYVISDKLNDFLTNVKIVISKTPEEEKRGAVLLKVEKVEGIEYAIDLNNIDLTKMDGADKNKIYNIVMNKVASMSGHSSFEEVLQEEGVSEEEFFELMGISKEEFLNLSITSLKMMGMNKIKLITNPEELMSNTCLATQNGKYTFKVTDVKTGKVYNETIEVNNIEENPSYLVQSSPTTAETKIYLYDNENKNNTIFDEAHIIYEGERIDITDCIEEYQDYCEVDNYRVLNKLVDLNKILDEGNLENSTQIFELVKDGKSYFGSAIMKRAE